MKAFVTGVFFLFLAGCGEQNLYSQLQEREVNEMIVLLHEANIPADKTPVKNGLFSIKTKHAYFPQAISVLSNHGLPRTSHESVPDLFPKEGFVSSPLEERVRLMYAQSQELSSTLENIDGVILARVHLAIPKADPLSEESKPASASVFIKYHKDVDLSLSKTKIKGLVVDGIEGLPYDNVTVALFPAEQYNFKKVSHEAPFTLSGSMNNPYLAIAMILLIGVFVLLGILLMRSRKQKNSSARLVQTKSINREQRSAG